MDEWKKGKLSKRCVLASFFSLFSKNGKRDRVIIVLYSVSLHPTLSYLPNIPTNDRNKEKPARKTKTAKKRFKRYIPPTIVVAVFQERLYAADNSGAVFQENRYSFTNTNTLFPSFPSSASHSH